MQLLLDLVLEQVRMHWNVVASNTHINFVHRPLAVVA
jgi:hypothetical protein